MLQVEVPGSRAFGRIIRTRRLERDATQEDVARKVGKTRRWLYDVERGARSPSLESSIALAKALDLHFLLYEPEPSSDLDSIFKDL